MNQQEIENQIRNNVVWAKLPTNIKQVQFALKNTTTKIK